jgi:paraquat-inducible protein A
MSMVMVCPACDLAHRRAAPPPQGRTECVRCRAPLQRPESRPIETAIALAICALVLLVLSNAYPLVEMHVNGATRDTTLVGAAWGMYQQHYPTLAALVLLTTVIAPLVQIIALLYLLIPLWRGRRARGQSAMFRVLMWVRRWSFMEVFMLGSLVALVRLSSYTHVIPGVSLWSCALLMIGLSALTTVSSPEQFWAWAEKCPR